MELRINPSQIGNGTMKMQQNSKSYQSVDSRDDNGLYFRRSESEITQAATAGCTLTLTLP